MKSIYVASLETRKSLLILGRGGEFAWDNQEDLHHLLRVGRLEVEEQVLFLLGEGRSLIAKFQNHTKFKSAQFQVQDYVEKPKTHIKHHLVMGKLKKAQLEDTLVDAVEMGLDTYQTINADYSQKSFLDFDRVQSLLKHAYQQSIS